MAAGADLVVVDVLERQHATKLVLVVAREAAAFGEAVGVLVGAEQAVPERQVAVVEAVHVELVMDRMQFRCLDEIFQPARRFEIRVIVAATSVKIVGSAI